MLLLYNIFQLVFLTLFWPLLLLYTGLTPKYRNRIPLKLGKSLKQKTQSLSRQRKTIWIHALSVGEVTSAVPLVRQLRQSIEEVNIVFSASTKTGSKLADDILSPYCDQIIVFPLDISMVVSYFLKEVDPDLFILVETDFWPNFLHQLKRKKIPALLVNGRISQKSMASYTKFRFFFTPMFNSFSRLCVQSDLDKKRFLKLGVISKKIEKLGNLKYEGLAPKKPTDLPTGIDSYQGYIIVAGSTHPGEEEILLAAFFTLQKKYNIRMILAPRQIDRTHDITKLAKNLGFTVAHRSSADTFDSDIFLLDTIGELIYFYSLADICFVGGSLIDEGGHNPLEPAGFGKPVLFGPDMADFEEISNDLLQSRGAFCITSDQDLCKIIEELFSNSNLLQQCGEAALNCVRKNSGTGKKHLAVIRELM